jgi:hypothetical protein
VITINLQVLQAYLCAVTSCGYVTRTRALYRWSTAVGKHAPTLYVSLLSTHYYSIHRRVEALEAELVDSRLTDARAAAVHSEVEQELLAMRDACAALVQQRATLCDEVSTVLLLLYITTALVVRACFACLLEVRRL